MKFRQSPIADGKQPKMPEVLTIREVAKYLRIKERTVYNLAQKGEIPAFKVGRQWRFLRNNLLAFIGRNGDLRH